MLVFRFQSYNREVELKERGWTGVMPEPRTSIDGILILVQIWTFENQLEATNIS